jgi:hypothetical protein
MAEDCVFCDHDRLRAADLYFENDFCIYSSSFNVKACHFAFTTYVAFAVVGGKSTGAFAGDSGPGGESLLRRVRAEVHLRPEEGSVQHKPERAGTGKGRSGIIPAERGTYDLMAIA